MSEVQRYAERFPQRADGWCSGVRTSAMRGDPQGMWVIYKDHAAALAEKDAEVERLRAALKFYAGTEHRDEWLVPSEEVRGQWMTPIELDGGERARAALNPEEVQP